MLLSIADDDDDEKDLKEDGRKGNKRKHHERPNYEDSTWGRMLLNDFEY